MLFFHFFLDKKVEHLPVVYNLSKVADRKNQDYRKIG